MNLIPYVRALIQAFQVFSHTNSGPGYQKFNNGWFAYILATAMTPSLQVISVKFNFSISLQCTQTQMARVTDSVKS